LAECVEKLACLFSANHHLDLADQIQRGM
jgi:hypothetical protein